MTDKQTNKNNKNSHKQTESKRKQTDTVERQTDKDNETKPTRHRHARRIQWSCSDASR